MAYHETQSASLSAGTAVNRGDSSLAVTRLEYLARTAAQADETESILVVLEGTLCLHLQGRPITLRSGEVLRIPAHVRYSAEPLAPVKALRISVALHNDLHPVDLSDTDSDHYLWGV